jgi:hypothetical protein
MSTRASIFEKQENGGYRGIYLHFDGYPKHAGEILKKYYDTPEKVSALIDLGDLSSIGKEITVRDTVAFHRDRNEKLSITTTLQPRNKLSDVIDGVDYTYVFENNNWTVDYSL